MKLPAKIFVPYVKDEGLETVGVFRTLRNNGEPNAEYIHRDVVELLLVRANNMIDLPIDNERFNEAIADAVKELKGVAK